MELRDDVEANLAQMQERSPSGFAIGLHLAFTTSKYIIQTYPKPWMEEYSKRGFLLSDPTVRWGLENTGFIRWSVLKEQDEGGVIDAAAEFGLNFGVSIAIAQSGSRSLGSFASPTAEFDDAVISDLTKALENLHIATQRIEPASSDDALIQRIVASFTSVEPN
ncbi:MAG: autoinducer binding domain-containing protein [Pseudomonadota bacterium]